MSGEPLSSTTIDPTLLQSLAQQHYSTSAQLSNFSQLQIASSSEQPNSTNNRRHSFNISASMADHNNINNNNTSAPAPININRSAALSANPQQPLSGSAAASFGTEYERGGLANSFHQQLQQQQQFQQQQQNFFRTQLGSPGQQEMFSPIPDDLSEISPHGSYQPHNSLAVMASAGTLPTSIPGALLGTGGQARPGHMLRVADFSNSPVTSPTFQSMSLPAHSDWFENHLGQQHSIGSALDSSSFTTAQQPLTGGHVAAGVDVKPPANFSPQNQTLMSLMEDGDGETSQKS